MSILTLLSFSGSSVSQSDFWRHSGLGNHSILSIICDLHGHIFAGTADRGVYRSTDGGQNWVNVKPLPERIEALTVDTNDFIFAGLSRSTDDGVSWSDLGLPAANAWSIYAAPNGHLFIGLLNFEDYVGGLFFRSTDSGDHWTNINSGLDSTLPLTFLHHSSGSFFIGSIWMDVYVDKPPPNEWFFSGGLRRSTDDGNTWVTPVELHDFTVSSLKEDRHGWIFSGTYWNGVYRSIDTGKTWTEVNEGLSNLHKRNIRSLVINPSGIIFVATLGGVFRSTDDGNNWIETNEGLIDTTALCIAFDPNGYAYVGTANGVFRSVQSTTSAELFTSGFAREFLLEQNFPNPFNPRTTIGFTLPRRAFTVVKVFNILGKEIATLVSQDLLPGRHNITWNAEGMPSGIYFYRLETGVFVETRKLIVLR
jgi:ligand-binding sensor domain-containing protein